MKYIESVHGARELAIPLIIQVDTVYVKTNIHSINHTDEFSGITITEWVWNEYQYDLNEYAIMRNQELNAVSVEQDQAILDQYETQMLQDETILAIYESMGVK